MAFAQAWSALLTKCRFRRSLSIAEAVPQLQRIIGTHTFGESRRTRYASIRHAEELHALGLKHEFTPAESSYLHVSLSIVVTTMARNGIWVRILWLGSEQVYPPKEDCKSWEFPLSEAGIRSFEERWPSICARMGQAIARRSPPANTSASGPG